MARNPFQWFPFYATDWLSDERVQVASLACQGAYLRLLCVQWIEGSIPAKDPHLAKLLGISLSEWSEISHEVLKFFVDNSAGRLVNKRLDCEREKQIRQHKRLSSAGKAGAKIRHYNGVDSQATPRPQAWPKPGLSQLESESEKKDPSTNVGGSQHLAGGNGSDRSAESGTPKPEPRAHQNLPVDVDLILDYTTEVLNKLDGVTEKNAERSDRPTLLRIAQHVPRSIAHKALEDTQDAVQRFREGKGNPVHVGKYLTARVSSLCERSGIKSPFDSDRRKSLTPETKVANTSA